MRSYPIALAWELQKRPRWGLAILLIYLAALLIFLTLMWTADPSPERMALLAGVAGAAAMPLAVAFTLMLTACSFGFQADLAGPESPYPSRLLTLPLRTLSLPF